MTEEDNDVECPRCFVSVPRDMLKDPNRCTSRHCPLFGPRDFPELHVVEASQPAGPWHVYLQTTDGRKIAALWGEPREKLEHAQLFAAAAAMLTQLQSMVKAIEGGHIDSPELLPKHRWHDEWLYHARAAIAQATRPPP